ncbi:TetR/AcrR family transcriptional regulator [Dermatobacter hominis]|uniref:TetR/AcrR family transcriptional regulator n=1 Tax=Dermatobacter hominis TaxID=2884263 RepID=UPI001D0F6DFD|nr:TetR/AcrR family transcriptional regulator [Dermatobacter hominis]UDY35146.1 TetR family transcriptional regulator [Dermatobacter hominis]
MAGRTQAERSAATQQLLVDAAIGLLVDRGWAATTAVAVCERAGCSRGALLHHFPNLSALLAHALESLHEDFASRARMPATTVRGIVDDVWRAAGDPRFKAVLEAWSAAANDPELATELAPAIGRFAALVSPTGRAPGSPVADADARAFVLTAREALLGLALGRAYGGGRPLGHERVVLDRLRAEADRIDARLDARVPADDEEDPT